MSKRTKFIPPIDLPDGKQLITLEDAGRYLMAMPEKKLNEPEWKAALRIVVRAINGEEPEMHARIAMMRALQGIKPGSLPPKPPSDPSKEIHWRNKKRDPWR